MRTFALTALVLGLSCEALWANPQDVSGLPNPIRADLDTRFPGWTLYDIDKMQPGERRYCKASSGNGSFIAGDFDGDEKQDYAVLIARGRQGYALAYLQRGAGYRAFSLFPAKASDTGSAGYVMLAPRGSLHGDLERQRNIIAPHDGVTLVFCESSVVTYFYSRGHFKPSFESD